MNQLDSIGRELFDVDYLSASAWDESAHDRMRRLRKDAPLYWAPQNELWIVSKYEDIVEISRDPELFCSGQGIRPGIPVRQALIDEDDPKHCQLRRTINRGFTPRMVKLLEEKFETITRNALSGAVELLIRNPEIRDRVFRGRADRRAACAGAFMYSNGH